MAEKDADLFDRLRHIGLRKQAAKALSGVSSDAGKKAQVVARAAVAELRAVADEIERRLPGAASEHQRAAAASKHQRAAILKHCGETLPRRIGRRPFAL